MTEPTEFSRLFRKYVDETANAEETQSFLSMADQAAWKEELELLVDGEMLTENLPYGLDRKEKQAILGHIFTLSSTKIREINPKREHRLWPRIAAAASVILLLAAGGYFILHKGDAVHYAGKIKNDVKSGSNGAILTLANGQKIILEQTKEGRIDLQDGTDLHKTGDSLLVYKSGETAANAGVYYNTLETPKGRQYSVVLPDGSRVWLNAASSLKYPTAFSGKERQVELTGEGYFEIAQDKIRPFKVKTPGQTVEVLGTHFNIKAYADEQSTWTTLLQGAVKVENSQHEAVRLKPGQQMVSGQKGEWRAIEKIDTAAVLDWKNGEFIFSGESLESVMHKVSRWYDVRVEYKDTALKKELFYGSVSRWANASEVMDMLALTGTIKFSIVPDDGPGNKKRIIVMK